MSESFGYYLGTIYVAASINAIEDARFLAKRLSDRGATVTSRWHEIPDLKMLNPAVACRMDIRDLEMAERLVVLTGDGHFASSSGGRHVELGFAMARDKLISIIGPHESCFTHASYIHQYDTVDQFLTVQWTPTNRR